MIPEQYKKKENCSNTYSLSPLGLWKIIKVCRYHDCCLIHCHGLKAMVAIGILRSFFKLPPVVYTIHGFHSYWKPASLLRWIRLRIEQWLFKKREKTIVVSKSDYHALKGFKSIQEKTVHLIENGIEIERPIENKSMPFEDIGYNQDTCQLFVSIGDVNRVKGYEVAIKAAELLAADQYAFKWVIIGDGDNLKKYRRKIQKMGLSNKVVFMGYRSNPLNWLSVADLYISTSHWEGTPYSILEAMVHKVPVLAPNVPGCRDLITNHVNGILYDRNNIDSLVSYIQEFIETPEKWKSFIHKSIHRLETNYTVSQMTQKVKAVYREVLCI